MKRAFILLVSAVLGLTLGANPAAAATVVHEAFNTGTQVQDLPAGTVCDFNYRGQAQADIIRNMVFDDQGNLLRTEVAVDVFVTHTNLDTGYVLTEEDRYSVHIDNVKHTVTVAGRDWALRTVDGQRVLDAAGLLRINLNTGEVKTTPGFLDFAATICPALGGAVAP